MGLSETILARVARNVTPDFKLKVDGLDITTRLRPFLLDLTIKDDAGRESDTIDLTLEDTGALPLPRDGAIIEAWLGYREEGDLPFMGRYTASDVQSDGSDSGFQLKIGGKAADLLDGLKERGFRHYDGMTLGDIFAEEAAAQELQAHVAPQLAGIKPDYALRDNISLLHFGEQMARQYDAAFKIANGHLLFVKRQGGRSLSGASLPRILAERPGNLLSWSVKPRIGRPRYGSATAEWYDRDKAQRGAASYGTDAGPQYVRRHLYPSQAQAEAAARSQKNALDRDKAGGSLTLIGTPEAMAESMIEVRGTREGVDGWWFGKSVSHSLTGSGFTTSIDIEPKIDG